jgi:hypothetical protein
MRGIIGRRSFLGKAAIGGGGLLIFAAGGLAWHAWDRGSFKNLYGGTGFEPWEDWRSNRHEGLLGLVSAAILASNPHNSQPWLFRLTNQRVDLYADLSRRLRSPDPFLRELFIGLGCALENLMVAARGKGYRARLTFFPSADEPSLVARVELMPGKVQENSQYRAIGERHTNRSAYDRARDLPPAILDALQRQVDRHDTKLLLFAADDRQGKLFADGTIDATARFVADPTMMEDSHRWFRYTLAEVNEKRDGLSLIGIGMPEWRTRVALSLPRNWLGDFGKEWLNATQNVHCATAPRFGLLAVRNRDDKIQLLEAGRLWQRLHLEGTVEGLAMHPLNQLMEIWDRDCSLDHISKADSQLSQIVSDNNWQAVFGFRCGYSGDSGKPSPRRNVTEIVSRL